MYTCRYSRGQFNPYGTELGIKLSTRISEGVYDCPCFFNFITMIPIDCKITKFYLILVYTHLEKSKEVND